MDPRSAAETFVSALASKDRDALTSVFAPNVDFRGLTPGDEWRATTPEEVAEVVFGSWFEPGDHILEELSRKTWGVSGRVGLSYQFHVESGGQMYFVEQQGFLDTNEEGIARMSLMCAGFRLIEDE